MSSLPTLVDAIDERLALLRAEIDKLTRSRATLAPATAPDSTLASRPRATRSRTPAGQRKPAASSRAASTGRVPRERPGHRALDPRAAHVAGHR